MIYMLTKYSIDDMLEDPKDYIDETYDEPILHIIHDDSHLVTLLLGYDEKANLYYFTLEDDETSEDFYCYDGNLAQMFDEIMKGKGDYEIWVKP